MFPPKSDLKKEGKGKEKGRRRREMIGRRLRDLSQFELREVNLTDLEVSHA
jgi:hypothetical protein